MVRLICVQELSRGRYKLDHSHFALYAKHFNQLAMWAASEIVLQGKDIARRTQALRAGMQLSNVRFFLVCDASADQSVTAATG